MASALLLTGITASAQNGSNKFIRKGNELYLKQQYTDAEANYKKALEQNAQSAIGSYNLGNSLYQQKRFDDARKQYANSLKIGDKKDVSANADYNIGNTYMEGKKWEESIKSYKQALKINPADEDARYNLAYAQAMLKKQQQGGGGDNKDNKDKKDNDKSKDKQKDDKSKDKDQQKDQKDQNKDQQNKDQNKDNKNKDDQQKPEPQPSKLNKQEAERLLQALSQEEKKLQDKAKKAKGQPVPVEKDW
ncbi:tetratricopeptide repeat protein [Chitinophaga sp. Mgbs1]|uniref:Tetratricopeptide repeat protein n=1 Tax=Chitinophaga solisilvae TaxID=1233460 RepID=A0A9Q5D9P8_9BACT|nr:tetratricopeptide repeat protein [Chitinophaga solisilvae]